MIEGDFRYTRTDELYQWFGEHADRNWYSLRKLGIDREDFIQDCMVFMFHKKVDISKVNVLKGWASTVGYWVLRRKYYEHYQELKRMRKIGLEIPSSFDNKENDPAMMVPGGITDHIILAMEIYETLSDDFVSAKIRLSWKEFFIQCLNGNTKDISENLGVSLSTVRRYFPFIEEKVA